jgi:hypothetical protein
MCDLTTEALLDAVRGWVEIESPTSDAAGANRVADHAGGLPRGIGATIDRLAAKREALPPLPPHVAGMLLAGIAMVQDQTFGCPADDREGVLAAYRRREAKVRAEIPPGRLLVFDVAEGWEPLCRFLGVPMPDEPFPKVNSGEEFWAPLGGTPI